MKGPAPAVTATLYEAQSLVSGLVSPLPAGIARTEASCWRVLGGAAVAAHDVPGFDASAMDGYAVRSLDLAGGADTFEVVGDVVAGSTARPEVHPGAAVAVMTGALLPPGADTVVPFELTRESSDAVTIVAPVRAGANVRSRGEDVRAGTVIADSGVQLTPRLVAALLAAGCDQVSAHRRVVVGVISTGDEVRRGGRPGRSSIVDANRPFLLEAMRDLDMTVVDGGVAPDERDGLRATLADLIERCDAVISTGGISAGTRDLVPGVLAELGDAHPLRLAIRPGKPFVVARVGDVPVFALPGNPLTTLVTFELLALPGLRRLAGHPDPGPARLAAVAAAPYARSRDGKVHYVHAQLGWAGAQLSVRPVASQGSHELVGAHAADALIEVADGDGFAEGATVVAIPLSSTRLPMVDRPHGGRSSWRSLG